MKNWTFRQWNTVSGWVIFVVAFFTYLSTIEPNFSFWDCGEYISSAVKLEVTHAPGAALFQIVGAVAAIFALGKGENYSIVINAMSALFSALTILFLFWTITHFVRRLLNKDFEEITKHQEISILFAGAIGALCFTFSDTFWFSAVEGEVYSMASMFIALLVWLITKWENEYQAGDSERWIILIFFCITRLDDVCAHAPFCFGRYRRAIPSGHHFGTGSPQRARGITRRPHRPDQLHFDCWAAVNDQSFFLVHHSGRAGLFSRCALHDGSNTDGFGYGFGYTPVEKIWRYG